MEFRRLLLPQLWSRDELVAFLPLLLKIAFRRKKIRFDAHEYCLSIGGYLVEIDTEEEEDWLLGAFAVYDQVWELENIYIYTFLSTQLENLKKFPPFSVNTHTGLLDWAD